MTRMCDDCGLRPANYCTEITLNGKKYEAVLCDECMKKRQNARTPVYQTFMQPELECPVCHTRLSDVVETRYVGCSECYKVFRGQVLNNIQEMHGTRKHLGSVLARIKTARGLPTTKYERKYHLRAEEGGATTPKKIYGFFKRGKDENKETQTLSYRRACVLREIAVHTVSSRLTITRRLKVLFPRRKRRLNLTQIDTYGD